MTTYSSVQKAPVTAGAFKDIVDIKQQREAELLHE